MRFWRLLSRHRYAVCRVTSLHEFDKDEWRDATRRLRPDWTDDQFERAWAEFVAQKRRKDMQ